MKALVIAEHEDVAAQLCAGARELADEAVLVFFGKAIAGVADKAVVVNVPNGCMLDDAADTVVAVAQAETPQVVLVEPTRRCKVIAAKLAHAFETAVITDALSMTADEGTSMYFGGVAQRTQKAEGPVTVLTVAPSAFGDGKATGTDAVEEAQWIAPARAVSSVSVEELKKSGADLNKADYVVAAGRGFAEESELDLARALCDKLGAGLGCSRPLTEGVDWLPRETYIGVTGLMISPKIYVACGISGQMQHMVGCNRAGTLFAINKDKNAPVFKQCDYGLVGDVAEVLPKLVEALQ